MSDIMTAATHPASQDENVADNNEARRNGTFGGEKYHWPGPRVREKSLKLLCSWLHN